VQSEVGFRQNEDGSRAEWFELLMNFLDDCESFSDNLEEAIELAPRDFLRKPEVQEQVLSLGLQSVSQPNQLIRTEHSAAGRATHSI